MDVFLVGSSDKKMAIDTCGRSPSERQEFNESILASHVDGIILSIPKKGCDREVDTANISASIACTPIVIRSTMSNIVKSSLPRAIAKDKDGITLYWVEELRLAGLHQNGIATLLKCDTGTIQHAIKSVKEFPFFEAEIITVSGLKTIKLISETDLAILLRHIARSKAKEETRDRADDVRDKLVAAGFKLMVMMEIAPETLANAIIDRTEDAESLKRMEQRIKTKISNKGLNAAIANAGGKCFAAVADINNKAILGGTAKQIREARGVKNTRDGLSRIELAMLETAELIEQEEIEEHEVRGDRQIISTCKNVAETMASLRSKKTKQLV